MNKIKLNTTIKEVTDLLARESYEALDNMSSGVQLTAKEIKQAVVEYGQSILPLTDEGYMRIDIIEVANSMPRRWSVNVPVFTKEDGESDLTLELTLIDSPNSLYIVEVDNLHVL